MSDSVQPHRRQPTRLSRPWDSPGKNTGVGCHFLLQCVKVKSESEVAQLCPTLSDRSRKVLPRVKSFKRLKKKKCHNYKVKMKVLVAQLRPTLQCSPPGSSVHAVLHERILESVAISFFKDLPNPGIELTSLMSPALASEFFTTSTIWEAWLKATFKKSYHLRNKREKLAAWVVKYCI